VKCGEIEMERVKKYIGVFIKLGVLVAILVWLPMSLKLGLLAGAIAAIKSAVIWTIIMALFFVPADYFSTRRLPPEALKLQHERELRVSGSREQVFEKCHAVLESLPFIKAVTSTNGGAQLSAKTKMSLASFGEAIELTFKIQDKNAVAILVNSRPAVRYTLLDFGKNFRNVEQIAAALNKHFKAG